MSCHLLLGARRTLALTIVGASLLTMGIGNAIGASIPFTEDFSGSAPDVGYTSSHVNVVSSVSGGVLKIDGNPSPSGPTTGGQAMNALVNIDNANGIPIVMKSSITPTDWLANGGHSSGFLAFSTNPAAGAFPSGPNSGYLTDFVISASGAGFIRILDAASGLASIVDTSASPFPAGSLAANETYHLTFTATPRMDGRLDLSLTMVDTMGTLIDGDGIVTISGTTPAAASTGTYFGYRHRVGNNGTSTLRTFDAVYDNFSLVPEPTALTILGIGAVYCCGVVRRRSPHPGR